jgi:hypothetical protein
MQQVHISTQEGDLWRFGLTTLSDQPNILCYWAAQGDSGSPRRTMNLQQVIS